MTMKYNPITREFNIQGKEGIDITTPITYYVETTGNDNNDGLTVVTALETVEGALKKLEGCNISAQVTILLGIGIFDIDSTLCSTYLKNVTTTSSATQQLINIQGTFTSYKTGCVITNITGRNNIRNFAGITETRNSLAGKFILYGTNYFPIAGNLNADIFVSSAAPTGTYEVFECGTTLRFASENATWNVCPRLSHTFSKVYITSNSTSDTLRFSHLYLKHCVIDRSASNAMLSNTSIAFIARSYLGRLGNTYQEIQLTGFSQLSANGIVLTNAYRLNGITNIEFVGYGNIVRDSNLGFVDKSKISGTNKPVFSLIDTDGSNGNNYDTALYATGANTNIALNGVETYGYVRLSLNTTSTWSQNFINTPMYINIKAFDSVNYPLNFVLPTLAATTEPPYDLKVGRSVYIEGQTEPFYNKIFPLNYQSIAEISALNSQYQFASCAVTGLVYAYVANGYSYTIDNVNVLATADGGVSRFVSITYPMQQHADDVDHVLKHFAKTLDLRVLNNEVVLFTVPTGRFAAIANNKLQFVLKECDFNFGAYPQITIYYTPRGGGETSIPFTMSSSSYYNYECPFTSSLLEPATQVRVKVTTACGGTCAVAKYVCTGILIS